MEPGRNPRGAAAAALARVVQDRGPEVLGHAQMLAGLLEDDVPHLPREVALLTAAARIGAAQMIIERLRQGLPPGQVVAMTAAEMSSRTALDASGCLWAIGEFARALGYPAQEASSVTVPQNVPEPGTQPDLTMVTADQTTVLPGTGPAELTDVAEPAGRAPTKALAITAAVAACVVAPMSLVRIPGSNLAIFALEGAALILGLGATAIWAVRRGGAGFAAALGLWAPLATLAIYHRAAAPGSFATPAKRDVVEVTSAIWVFVALTATWITIAGLAVGRRIARHKIGVLATVTVIAGVAFAFTNILAQVEPQSRFSENVLGADVHNRRVLWGLMFLALVALPPLIGLFLARPGDLPAMWSGWLAFGLAWQVANTPVHHHAAAPGLYVTWLLWVVVLLGTVIMADRARGR